MYDVLIVGAGISGLSSAWFLKKQNSQLKIGIVEQKDRAGGWIRTLHDSSGQLYETGPRSFRYDVESPLVELIRDLQLEKELIFASPQAKKRYLLRNQKISSLPKWVITRGLFKYLLSRNNFVSDDESVFAFFSRRFGKEFAEIIADSLVTGIYAGDSHTLSMKHTFGQFSFFKNRFKIATLKPGLSAITESLQAMFDVQYGIHVQSIHERDQDILVETNQGPLRAQRVISTLPHPNLPYTSVVTVLLGFSRPMLFPKGFGMLVPTGEHPELLGVVFDSEVFPEQNSTMQSRCTLMFGGARAPLFCRYSDSEIEAKVLEVLSQYFVRYLGISEPFIEMHIFRAERAIPHFPVGFDRGSLRTRRLFQAGSWASGVALGDCVAFARKIAHDIAHEIT